jgi:hypothetical protein
MLMARYLLLSYFAIAPIASNKVSRQRLVHAIGSEPAFRRKASPMNTLASPAPRVKVSRPELSDSPGPFPLRRAAGFIRQAIRVDVAVLTGDKSGRLLATVGLVQIGKAAARRPTPRRAGISQASSALACSARRARASSPLYGFTPPAKPRGLCFIA